MCKLVNKAEFDRIVSVVALSGSTEVECYECTAMEAQYYGYKFKTGTVYALEARR